MDYFYAAPADIRGDTLYLRGNEFKHLSRVLRKKIGDRIAVTDGEGNMVEAVIQSFDHSVAECRLLQTQKGVNEPKMDLTLAVSLLKSPARIDFLVEKATELGVRTIIPLLCERTIPKHEKHARLEKIALASMKQCGRSYLPRIFMLTSFETLVNHAQEYDLKLIPHEKTEQSQFVGTVVKHHATASSTLILIGPEGGFSNHEIELASRNGFIPISLGPRRLRSETAALSAMSWIVGSW